MQLIPKSLDTLPAVSNKASVNPLHINNVNRSVSLPHFFKVFHTRFQFQLIKLKTRTIEIGRVLGNLDVQHSH